VLAGSFIRPIKLGRGDRPGADYAAFGDVAVSFV
jgi:hypothetical protein